MDFSEAITIISEYFRIKNWAQNEFGERYAVLDENIELKIFQGNSDTLVAQGIIGEPITNPSLANANENKLKFALQNNFIRIVKHDETLAIDKRSGRISVTRYIKLMNASLDSILDSIESFVDSVDFWDTLIQRKQSFAVISPLLGFFRRQ